MNNYLKNKAFETYMLLIEGHDKSKIDERLKKYIYQLMKRDKLSFDIAIVRAILCMGKLTQCDPSWLVPAPKRTTDGGKGSGNFVHKECFGQVEGSSKAGGTLKTESVTVDFGTIDEGDRVNRKMLLDVVDALIDINRKLNKVGKTGIKKSAGLGLQEVADAVRDYDKRQEFDRVNAELDKKIQSLKEALGI